MCRAGVFLAQDGGCFCRACATSWPSLLSAPIACSFFSLNHTAVRSLLLSPRDGLLGARTHAAQWPRAVLRSELPGQPGAASSRGRPQRCPSFHSSHLVVAAVLNRQFAALLVKLGRLFLCLACDRLLSLSTVAVHAGSLGWGVSWALRGVEPHPWPHPLDARGTFPSPRCDSRRRPQTPPSDRGQSALRLRTVLCNSPHRVSIISAFPVAGFSQFLVYLSALFLMCYCIEYFKVYCQIWLFL